MDGDKESCDMNKISRTTPVIIFAEKYSYSLLLLVVVSLLIIELALYILWGYTSGDILVFLLMDFVPRIRFAFTIICLITTLWLIIKHQIKVVFTVTWILLAILGYLLNQNRSRHFETLGSLLALYNTTPAQVLSDARILADQYPPMTCIGYPNQREPCNNAISRNNIPSSIKNLHIGNVLILDNYVLIEKFGLQGVFRGFIVFREDSDLWKNEASITRNDCSDCWKIRITDGLYWYSAPPSSRPIFSEGLQ